MRAVRTVTYTAGALRDFRRYGNVAGRIRRAIDEYAADPRAHANNVTQLVGSPFWRMRVADFRVIFDVMDTTVTVVKIAPRGSVYDWEHPMPDTVTLTRAEYQDLIDARDAALAMRDVASGTMPTIDDADVDAYLAAPTPLAFWRKRRGLTQAALAGQVGISQPYLAQIEGGHRGGDVILYSKLARTLTVRIEDLVPEDDLA